MAEIRLMLSDLVVVFTTLIMIVLFVIALGWLYLAYTYADNATRITLLLVYAYLLLPISVFALGLFHFLKGYRI